MPLARNATLPIFRPQSCPDPALLERMLFGRERLAEVLVDRVRDSVLGSACHQQLVYGPRGSGKTHLLTVVFNRLRNDETLCHRLKIARLPEEQWEIASFLDFCKQILRALKDAYPGTPAAEWTERESSVPLPTRQTEVSLDELRRLALQLIQETIGEGVLLIIVENLGDLFKALGTHGQQQLRAQIQQFDNWILIGSSQSLFRALTSRDEPFFGFFQTHDLAPLNARQTLVFLRRLAGDGITGDAALGRILCMPLGEQRVRAIHHLCGGNHRLLTMLHSFLSRDGLVDLVEPFVEMIDQQLTPYYQERLRWLSTPQQRRIVAWLARAEKPPTMKAVARGCLLTEQIASAQLRELEKAGFVQLNRRGRQTFCEMREPLLRMVLDLQDGREDDARLAVRLLRAWYSCDQVTTGEAGQSISQTPADREGLDQALRETSKANGAEGYSVLNEAAIAPEQHPCALAVVARILDVEASMEGGLELWASVSESLRPKVEELLIASIGRLFANSKHPAQAARAAARRVETILGRKGLAGKTHDLLIGGAGYLEAGRDERAILDLPQEHRRLIIEACGDVCSDQEQTSSQTPSAKFV